MQYRREIDGLRAVAVLPVILFHAGLEVFSGGFVGVDVFFVLSGYLITSILIGELQQGSFSIVNFYERRTRRILPALFFVMICCIPLAWAWMFPWEFKEFADSVMAVSVFSSNVLFWKESGYFAAAAEAKPLLHTWSLAVEEQYYVVFPLLLGLLWRFGRRWALQVTVLLAVASLLLSEWGWRNEPSATFYLAPTRAWELLAGSICAFLLQGRAQSKNDPLAAFGLALIVFAIFAFDRGTPFPSVFTLVPVVGTAMVILFGAQGTWTARVLSTKSLVGVGLISYSAYLWHQPLFAFGRIRSLQEPALWLMLCLAAGSLGLAYLSWRYVEKPFRTRVGPALPSRRAIFGATGALVSVFVAFGVYVDQNNGLHYEFSREELKVISYLDYDQAPIYNEGTCFLRPNQAYDKIADHCMSRKNAILVIGDSHAAALSAGIRKYYSVNQITASGCPPLYDLDVPSRPNCRGVNDFVFENIGRMEPSVIILHADWGKAAEGVDARFDATLEKLAQVAPASTIIIAGGVPQWTSSLPERLLSEKVSLTREQDLEADLEEVASTDLVLSKMSQGHQVTFAPIISKICSDLLCPAVVRSETGFAPTAWDDEHLTAEGSEYVFRESLRGVVAEKAAEISAARIAR